MCIVAEGHLIGIVWSGFLGLAIGNFSTSPLYRLPRGKSLTADDPYCDTCHARLTPRDLFPVFSWLASRGKCRHCAAPIPGIYTVLEIITCVLFIFCYLKFAFSESFLLVAFGLTSLVLLLFMLTNDHFFSDRTFFVIITLGALYRTLQEGTIYGFAGGAFAALLAGVLAWRMSGKTLARDLSQCPAFLKLLIAAGVWLPLIQLLIVFAAASMASLIRKSWPLLPEWTIVICVMVLLLH